MNYVKFVWDKTFGNESGVPQPVGYCRFCWQMRGMSERKISILIIPKDRLSGLCCFQMVYHTKIQQLFELVILLLIPLYTIYLCVEVHNFD